MKVRLGHIAIGMMKPQANLSANFDLPEVLALHSCPGLTYRLECIGDFSLQSSATVIWRQ